MRFLLPPLAAMLMAQSALASSRDFVIALPGHGTLTFTIPVTWQVEGERDDKNSPPTIVVRPESGEAFVVTLVPRWGADGAPDFNTVAGIKEVVGAMAESAGPTTPEGKPVVSVMKTSSGTGYWYWTATPAPPATRPSSATSASVATYGYHAQGALPAGELRVEFTARTRAQPPESLLEILAALATLRQVHEPK